MGKKRLYVSNTIPCCVTGQTPVDLHHLYSRGAGGGDEDWNLIPLCREMHQKIHNVGMTTFILLHPEAKSWMMANGWYFEACINRWRHMRTMT